MKVQKETVRERYRKLSDEQLIKIATYEAADLNLIGLNVLKVEIENRNLGAGILAAIDAQLNGMEESQFLVLYENLIHLPCPQCGQEEEVLESGITTEVVSVVFFTNRTQSLKIACLSCLEQMQKVAFNKTFWLGWWGFPTGIIRTVQAIGAHNQSYEKRQRLSEKGLFQFVHEHAAFLLAHQDNPAAIYSY